MQSAKNNKQPETSFLPIDHCPFTTHQFQLPSHYGRNEFTGSNATVFESE